MRGEGGTTLLFVRHTDVENPHNIFYGRLAGYGLSQLGREQAERSARVLAEEPVAAFYTSPMLRARQTARVLSEPHGLKPRVSWLLAEVRTAWQGRTFDDLDAIEYDFYSRLLHPRDETLPQVWRRITRFTRMVREAHPGGTVVAVTHGDVMMTARAGYVGLPPEVASIRLPQVYSGKGSMTRLDFAPDLGQEMPRSVEYFDPNGDDPYWSRDWVPLDARGAVPREG
jgi:broad specificity phosphatase PhoE